MTTGEPGQRKELVPAPRKLVSAGTPLLAGILSGGIGLAISFGLRGSNLGRPLGDPTPLMVAVTQITNGFTYFPWRPALYHLIFAVLLGVLSLALLAILKKGNVSRKEAVQAGRIAALINVLFVAATEVDAVVVGFWYLVSGLASILISGLVAGLVAGLVDLQLLGRQRK